MAIIEQTSRRVVVSMPLHRWNRIQQLEKAYEIAQAVIKAKKECQTSEAMSVAEAYNFIDTL